MHHAFNVFLAQMSKCMYIFILFTHIDRYLVVLYIVIFNSTFSAYAFHYLCQKDTEMRISLDIQQVVLCVP